MFETKIYIVWKSSKGSKEIYAIFADKATAEYNAKIWQKEIDEYSKDFKFNLRVKEETMYIPHIPYIMR